MTEPLTILVADDDPTVGLLMRATLERSGYQVLVARNGLEAMTAYEQGRFDLVMLDVDMPGMNGIQVCASMRASAGPILPIVMVTGLDDVNSIESAYLAGATSFIMKPIHWALVSHQVSFFLRAVNNLIELSEAKQRSDKISAELSNTLKAVPDLLFDVDQDGRYLGVHAQQADLLWATAESVIGKRVVEVLPADAATVCMAALAEAKVSGLSRGRQYALNLNQGTRWFELSVARKSGTEPVRSDFVVLARDITRIKEQQHQLEHFAQFDTLTGLPNRVLLADRLQQSMLMAGRRNLMLAVAYLDLDDFKPINERYGHEVGDRILVVLAERMKAALRDGDTLARIGGDEFVAVLADLRDEQECRPMVECLLEAAGSPITVGPHVIQLSASIGVTHYPGDAVQAELLIRHADQAMYQAKQSGKRRCHLFDVVQDAAIKTLHENVERFRNALSQREFVLFYQPKVDLGNHRVIGVEALIRWQHPQRGLLSPAAFLPQFEQHPFSVDLGNWVIDTALDQVQAWCRQGLNLPVSVNIGGLHLQSNDFVSRLERALASRPELPATSLELELLETAALIDLSRVSEVMLACRDIGVGFALDDFGTGYSSLAYLRHLPVDTLKIDQHFVCNLLEDTGDLAIVKGVISLARTFGRKVIAEGVETPAIGKLLLQNDCPYVQGYAIARPMPATAVPQWIAGWPDQSRAQYRTRDRNSGD